MSGGGFDLKFHLLSLLKEAKSGTDTKEVDVLKSIFSSVEPGRPERIFMLPISDGPSRTGMACVVFVCIWVTLLAGGCGNSTEEDARKSSATPASKSKTLVIGSISSTIREEVEQLDPFVNYLASQLKDQGYSDGEVFVVQSLDEMVNLLVEGEVDIVIDSPYPIGVMVEQAGAKVMLRCWKDGYAEYHSVFFKKKDAIAIDKLGDLVGKVVAFDDRYSTSGFILPMQLLGEHSLPMHAIEPANPTPYSDAVNYIFSGDDDNTIAWVLRGNVDVGVVDNITFEAIPETDRNLFSVLAETESVPRKIIARRAGLAPELVQALTDVLISLDGRKEGEAVLSEVKGITKFDVFSDMEANAALLKKLQEHSSLRNP